MRYAARAHHSARAQDGHRRAKVGADLPAGVVELAAEAHNLGVSAHIKVRRATLKGGAGSSDQKVVPGRGQRAAERRVRRRIGRHQRLCIYAGGAIQPKTMNRARADHIAHC